MAIQHYIVDELLKLLRGNITITVNRPEPQRKAPRNLRTNIDDIAKASGQAKSDGVEMGELFHAAVLAMSRSGADDTNCPSGSRKKYNRRMILPGAEPKAQKMPQRNLTHEY